ncbi:TPR-like protein [Dioscorea alata]|uniref:TPR-like protein n=1 Tax=Dioscorea alata TaxID=55571 RepID=A0ACB7V2H7_DIOAL|nr:TPR-like protein [Dioscorea alata]
MNTRCFARAIHASSTTKRSPNYHHLLRSCSSPSSLLPIHGRLIVLGALSDDPTRTLLLNSYSSLHLPDAAVSVFNSSTNPSIILWNSIIRCLTRNGRHSHALRFYHDMLDRGVEPDRYTFTFALKACAGCLDFHCGALIHQEIDSRGLQGDVFISTGLVDMYAKSGAIDVACQVFDAMPEPDVVSWNAMIAGFAQSGKPRDALDVFRKMLFFNVAPNFVTFLNLFPAVCQLSAAPLCRAIHGYAVRRCLLCSVFNGLIDAYAKCGRPEVARRIFDGISDVRDDVSWGTMISGYAYNGCFAEALELFDDLKGEDLKLNQVSAVSALSAAAEMEDLEKGVDIHACAVQKGMVFDVSVKTMLLTMYAKCGDLAKAKSIFEEMLDRDIVAWSAMISACAQMGRPEEAIFFFREMFRSGVTPNLVTVVSALPACAELAGLKLGKSIHCYALKSSISFNVSVGTALIAMYAQCGNFTSAHALFDRLPHKDIASWNALINGYAQSGDADNALRIFHSLQSTGQRPDRITMIGVLLACTILSALDVGQSAQGLVIKKGLEENLHVKNASIDMYAKCGDISSAQFLFAKTNSRNDLISWNTIISGYMHSGCANDAISAFHQMRAENLKPNSVTLVSIIPATAYLAALRQGVALHSYVIRTGFEHDVSVGNSFIDMYSKCGQLDIARKVFDHMESRDTVSWNVMLAGYAIHGLGESAISFFSQMKENCIQADAVSFISILSACRHGGLIAEGKKIFNSMKHEYNLEPNLEHYACVVDMLGRAGQLEEAWSLIQRMPMAPDAALWGALLGACRMHTNVWMAEIALDHLARLEPQNPGHYVVLSNIYAQAGRWTDARKIRAAIRSTGSSKTPGCSWVEINNTIHAFMVGDQSHPQYESIQKVWNELHDKMEKMGYLPDTSSVLHNVEEEEKEFFLYNHSERLAMSFAILNTEPGMTIQIVKNLRVCGDCHAVTKLVSKITGRKIIVRDANRFHHFENGSCSCRDFW